MKSRLPILHLARHPLWLAAPATLALAGCACTPPPARYTSAAPSPSHAGPATTMGMTGASSARSAGGLAGPQGPDAGVAVQAGPVWREHTDYLFSPESSTILRSDGRKTEAIASYLRENPSTRVGLDGADMIRIAAVREALVAAGVAHNRIVAGPFGDPKLRRGTRVGVLLNR